jgi:hypothetical protein
VSDVNTSNVEVRNDDKGELDEIVAFGAYVHLERMDRNWFCLIVEQGNRRLLVNVGARSGQACKATIYADEEAEPPNASGDEHE